MRKCISFLLLFPIFFALALPASAATLRHGDCQSVHILGNWDWQNSADREYPYTVNNVTKDGVPYDEPILMGVDIQWHYENVTLPRYTFDIDYGTNYTLAHSWESVEESEGGSALPAAVYELFYSDSHVQIFSDVQNAQYLQLIEGTITPVQQIMHCAYTPGCGAAFCLEVRRDFIYDYQLSYSYILEDEQGAAEEKTAYRSGTITIQDEADEVQYLRFADSSIYDMNATMTYDTENFYPTASGTDLMTMRYIQDTLTQTYTSEDAQTQFNLAFVYPPLVIEYISSGQAMPVQPDPDQMLPEEPMPEQAVEEHAPEQPQEKQPVQKVLVMGGVALVFMTGLGSAMVQQPTQEMSALEQLVTKVTQRKGGNFSLVVNEGVMLPEYTLQEGMTIDIPIQVENGEGSDWTFLCATFLGKHEGKKITSMPKRSFQNMGMVTIDFAGDEIAKKQWVYCTIAAVSQINGKPVTEFGFFEFVLNPPKPNQPPTISVEA